MEMYISLQELAVFILFMLVVIIGIYIIVLLRRVLCLVTLVQGVLEEQRGNIGKTVSLCQETLTHLNEIAISTKALLGQVQQPVNSLSEEIGDTVDNLRESIELITLYARLVVDFVKTIFSK